MGLCASICTVLAALVAACVIICLTLYGTVNLDPRLLDGEGGCHLEPLVEWNQLEFDEPYCVFITGASSGLGRSMAQQFYDKGNVRVITTGRSKQRAADAVETRQGSSSSVHPVALDQEDAESIKAAVSETLAIVQTHCGGKLDAAFLNAGMLYAMDFYGPFVAKDGKTEKLFAANFLGVLDVIRGLKEMMKESNTRIVYVGSVAIYGAVESDVMDPTPPTSKNPLTELHKYCGSKLALHMAYKALRENGELPNALSTTCGAVDTPIYRGIGAHNVSNDGGLPWPMNSNGVMFSSDYAGSFVARLAFLPLEKVSAGEFVLPYIYFLASNKWLSILPRSLEMLLRAPLSEGLQVVTHVKDHIWVCPGPRTITDTFEKSFRAKYLPWL